MWNLVSQPGNEPMPLSLEGRVLTTGPPGKSPLPKICLTFFIPFKLSTLMELHLSTLPYSLALYFLSV